MKLDKEILKRQELELPIFYTGTSCADEIHNRITAFHDFLASYEIDKNRLDCILLFRDNLQRMFDEYYLGHQSNAYSAFISALPFLFRDAPVIKTHISPAPLFRARINDSNDDYKDDEMFHIKYSDRGKVGTQRFSFPGLPCLYLGASSYVCWLELDRPPFEQFQVAIIEQNVAEGKRKCVLDLSIHPLTFYNELVKRAEGDKTEHEGLLLEDYLQYWPIIAACSIAVKNKNDAFKPEYTFPQFLLQLIIEEKSADFIGIDGIKYMSIKAGWISMKQYESDYRTYTNYVFPIKSKKHTSEGFCMDLSSYFHIKNNYSGKELQVLSDLVREKGIKFDGIEDKSTIANTLIFGSNDMGYSYKNSIFGRIEKILMNTEYEDGEIIFDPVSNDEIDDLF